MKLIKKYDDYGNEEIIESINNTRKNRKKRNIKKWIIFSFLIALLIFFVLVTFNKIEIEFLQKYRYLIGVFGILFTTAFIERFARR